MNKVKTIFLAGLLAGAVVAGQAYADPINQPPPPNWILTLNGGALPLSSFQQYTTSFVATQGSTNITFALRDDPAFIHLDDVYVNDASTPAVNLIQNAGFEGGTTTSGGNTEAAVDWSYLNQYGAQASGVVSCGETAHSGSCVWYDGAVQAYDAITQAISTTIGHTYDISFWAYEDSGLPEGTNWSALSTNGDTTDTGGNGINITVYAGAIPPPTGVPEPAALGMFGFGALLIGAFVGLRRRFQ